MCNYFWVFISILNSFSNNIFNILYRIFININNLVLVDCDQEFIYLIHPLQFSLFSTKTSTKTFQLRRHLRERS